MAWAEKVSKEYLTRWNSQPFYYHTVHCSRISQIVYLRCFDSMHGQTWISSTISLTVLIIGIAICSISLLLLDSVHPAHLMSVKRELGMVIQSYPPGPSGRMMSSIFPGCEVRKLCR
jgi:hypothetical protein